MNMLEMQVDALMRLCAAERDGERQAVMAELRELLSRRPRVLSMDPEYQVRQLMLELGTPDHLLGHSYVVRGILLGIQDRKFIDSITFRLYPQIAAEFDTTAARVERAIRHLIEVTWSRGDMEALSRCFGNTVNPLKGKPTNGEFIARMVNIVKQRIREVG